MPFIVLCCPNLYLYSASTVLCFGLVRRFPNPSSSLPDTLLYPISCLDALMFVTFSIRPIVSVSTISLLVPKSNPQKSLRSMSCVRLRYLRATYLRNSYYGTTWVPPSPRLRPGLLDEPLPSHVPFRSLPPMATFPTPHGFPPRLVPATCRSRCDHPRVAEASSATRQSVSLHTKAFMYQRI